MNPRVSFLIISLALLAPGIPKALGRDNTRIQEVELDEHCVYTVPVAFSRVTTISFPGPISAIDGALVTVDGKAQGLFQLAHKAGSYFFSVRSLVKGATTNVNVRWKNKTYVLELQDSATPVLSLIFNNPNDSKRAVTTSAVTPSRLLGLLDKAKAYPILKANHPEAVEQTEYVSYGEKPPVMDYNEFEIRIEEAFRFDVQDTLVFRVVLRNKTDKEVLYSPEGFSIRVGERLYFQSISDASGVMSPKSDTPAYFAITGTPSGGRNDVSLKNEFTVLLTRVDSDIAKTARNLPLDKEAGFSK